MPLIGNNSRKWSARKNIFRLNRLDFRIEGVSETNLVQWRYALFRCPRSRATPPRLTPRLVNGCNQAISQVCAFPSLFRGILGILTVMAIFRQLPQSALLRIVVLLSLRYLLGNF